MQFSLKFICYNFVAVSCIIQQLSHPVYVSYHKARYDSGLRGFYTGHA